MFDTAMIRTHSMENAKFCSKDKCKYSSPNRFYLLSNYGSFQENERKHFTEI